MSKQVGIPVYIEQNQQFVQPNVIVCPPVYGTNQEQLPQWANGFDREIEIQCQYCKKQTVTVIKRRVGSGTLICSFILTLTFPLLCWLPFVKESCQDIVHECPHCNHKVGIKKYKACTCKCKCCKCCCCSD